ncbi:MAG: tRNA uridine-5-carboxymethylaminomethyl(34) synthesis GTPase MnmE [Deltaproteobacteria bacterium]|nr:tRNA uridine-5-carboxymethylaminomethyl(34) synthesis GTPase MnmE [Deltaproteobacteria bacterium]
MRDPRREETIVAIATPPGPGAIGIVRMSGPAAVAIAHRVWRSRDKVVDNFESHRIYYGSIVDNSTGLVVDRGLLLYFRGPHSYTGEDVIEWQVHGNPLILDQILAVAQAEGAELAAPGEFTRRAFLNGRIDLAQAEAVADIVAAASNAGLRQAEEQLSGRLSQQVRADLGTLTTLRAYVEATIDFPEEDATHLDAGGILLRVTALHERLSRLAATYQAGRLVRDGARIVLTGPPNAGKSSLLNQCLGEARALVHHTAGTTRDTIEESLCWEGIPIRLVDTAGLRALVTTSAHDDIESLGMIRTREWIARADLVVLVLDGHTPLDRSFFISLPTERLIVWRNKSDLRPSWDDAELRYHLGAIAILHGSAITGEGLEHLQRTVCTRLRGAVSHDAEGVVVTTRRHKIALDGAVDALQNGRVALEEGRAPEFVAEHLRVASERLGEIVGVVSTEALLTEIFQHFCIGK